MKPTLPQHLTALLICFLAAYMIRAVDARAQRKSPTRRFKVGFGWGHIWLDRFGVNRETDSYQTRLQWIF